ncbi:MAG TPA: hypothetical protein VIZ65_00485 [Cellvibrionaceae bacterium]
MTDRGIIDTEELTPTAEDLYQNRHWSDIFNVLSINHELGNYLISAQVAQHRL